MDHDGTCDLIFRRTYAPGWTARIDAAPPIPVVPVDGGLQSVRLTGSGRTEVALTYRPPHRTSALVVSLMSLGVALFALVAGLRRANAIQPHREQQALR